MNDQERFRTGPVRFSDWKFFWKSSESDPPLSEEEITASYWSLTDWLGREYNVRPVPVKERECYVLTPHWRPDRTHHIEISRAEVLDRRLLHHVQTWIREKGRIWRVSIPTDDTDENVIMIYAEKITINEQAENNLEVFLHMIRPLAQEAFERALRRDTLKWSVRPRE